MVESLMNGEETSLLNRLESVLGQTRDNVTILQQGYAGLQRNVDALSEATQRNISALSQDIKALSSKLEERSRANWPAIALAVSLFVFAVPGVGLYVSMETSSSVSPIAAATAINSDSIRHLTDAVTVLQQMASSSTSADVNSRTDRAQLNDRVQKLESEFSLELANRRAAAAKTEIQLAEVEQQFHSVSNLENLRAAQQERLNSIMWEKSHPGERYPNTTWFPTSLFQGDGGSVPMVNPQ